MKALLEFDLPEEQEEFNNATNGGKYRYALSEFYEKTIRARLKYRELTKEQRELMEEIRDEYVSATEDCGEI